MFRLGPISIMAGECPEATPPADLGDHRFFAMCLVEEADARHARLTASGSDELCAAEHSPLPEPADKP